MIDFERISINNILFFKYNILILLILNQDFERISINDILFLI